MMGTKTLDDLKALGADLISTEQALALLP